MFKRVFDFKQILCLLLALVLTFGALAGCKKTGNDPATSSDSIASSDAETEPNDSSEVEEESFEETTEPEEEEEEVDYSHLDEIENFPYRVYNAKAPIMNNYRGMSATVWHAYGFMKDDKTGRVYTDEMMDIEMDRLQRMGVKTCRTAMKSQWIWSEKNGNWDFNSARANYFYDYCKALQDRDMNVMMQVGWDIEFVCRNVEGSTQAEADYLFGEGNSINGEEVGFDFSGMDEKHIRMSKAALRFGYLYSELLFSLKQKGIHNIDYLSYFTEPSNRNTDGSYHVTSWGPSAEDYIFICRIIKDYLDKTGASAWSKGMGPNAGGHNPEILHYTLMTDPDLFDIYSSHIYPTCNSYQDNTYYDTTYPLTEAYINYLKQYNRYGKKEFWYDEFFANDTWQTQNRTNRNTSAWPGLQTVVSAIASGTLGVNNIITWQAIDQLWTDTAHQGTEFVDGIHMVGMVPSLFVSDIPRGAYYMCGLFSYYNGFENGKFYETSYTDYYVESGLHISAVELEDGNWTITVVNVNPTETTFTLNFDKALNKTLYRHKEESATLVPDSYAYIADVDKVYADVEKVLCDTIPGGSMAVYTSVAKTPQ